MATHRCPQPRSPRSLELSHQRERVAVADERPQFPLDAFLRPSRRGKSEPLGPIGGAAVVVQGVPQPCKASGFELTSSRKASPRTFLQERSQLLGNGLLGPGSVEWRMRLVSKLARPVLAATATANGLGQTLVAAPAEFAL